MDTAIRALFLFFRQSFNVPTFETRCSVWCTPPASLHMPMAFCKGLLILFFRHSVSLTPRALTRLSVLCSTGSSSDSVVSMPRGRPRKDSGRKAPRKHKEPRDPNAKLIYTYALCAPVTLCFAPHCLCS
jgi:hypothetical protein